MGQDANWIVVEDTPEKLVIKDVGPWDVHKSITNDAEGVVERLAIILKGRRLMVIDSEGELGELLVDHDFGQFAGFA